MGVQAVKRTRFLSKHNGFLIWSGDNDKIHDERNDLLKWPGSGDKFHDNKMIEGTNNHDEPSPIK